MDGGERGLQAVGAEAAGGEGAFHQGQALGDLALVPAAAILVFEQDQVASGRGARRAPRFLEQHQRKQTHDLGFGEELDEEATEANRFSREIGADQRVAGGGGVALVEDEVDDAEDGIEAFGQVGQRRNLVGDAGCRESWPWRGRCAGRWWAGGRGRRERFPRW
ncbi:MAG: hypothetical protein U0232_26005 [Thermomicrobiales bacterium]